MPPLLLNARSRKSRFERLMSFRERGPINAPDFEIFGEHILTELKVDRAVLEADEDFSKILPESGDEMYVGRLPHRALKVMLEIVYTGKTESLDGDAIQIYVMSIHAGKFSCGLEQRIGRTIDCEIYPNWRNVFTSDYEPCEQCMACQLDSCKKIVKELTVQEKPTKKKSIAPDNILPPQPKVEFVENSIKSEEESEETRRQVAAEALLMFMHANSENVSPYKENVSPNAKRPNAVAAKNDEVDPEPKAKKSKSVGKKKKTPATCNICGKVLEDPGSLNRHKEMHNENRIQYQCPLCDHKMSKRYNLVTHMKRHRDMELTPEEELRVKQCDEEYMANGRNVVATFYGTYLQARQEYLDGTYRQKPKKE